MSEIHYLNRIFSPEDFTSFELQTILSKFTSVQFTKNSYFLQEGIIENHYWFIEKGFARAYATDPEGRDITTHFFTPGDIVIDWPSIFLRSPTRENIQALTDCYCWQIDYESFQELFHSIRNFREHGRSILVSSYFSLKKQRVSMISDQARERYLNMLHEKPELIQNVSLKYIATYLGITDTSLSRIRKEISE